MSRARFLLFLLIAVALSSARADYPAARLNRDLKEQLEPDPNRLIPSSEHFSFAVDGTTAFRHLETDDYFHGVHYWLQVRSEARASPYLKVNLRSIFYAGSASYGYAAPGGSYHLFALTGILPEPFAGGRLFLRILDLDRQTSGRGLVIQQEEFNGAWIDWQRDHTRFSLRADGTGIYTDQDDLLMTELTFWDGRLGFGAVTWFSADSYFSVFSSVAPSAATLLEAEAGIRSGSFAGLLAANAETDLGLLSVQGRVEGRIYQEGFAPDFAGRAQQLYISYDQLDKPFTNFTNLLPYDDDARVGAFHLNLRWNRHGRWRAEALNEAGAFFLGTGGTVAYNYHRLGLSWCPVQGRDDCITLFGSNKILTDNSMLPPSMTSTDNLPLFREREYYGVEGTFRL